MVRLDQLLSRTPDDPRRASERIDPYWDHLWRVGSTGTWLSRLDVERLEAASVAKRPAMLKVIPSDARARVLDPRNREAVMRMLGALHLWRTLTAEQLEALTGVPGIARGSKAWWPTLWAAGLIEYGVSIGWERAGTRGADVVPLRPARDRDVLRAFEDSLTYPEWLRLTAGRELDNARQFTRHNVLATELGLRMAEFGHVGTVLGEKLADWATLAYEGWGIQAPMAVTSDSDLVVVRPDGLRIAVEVTASRVGPWFRDKVTRMVTTLHRRPLNESGLTLVFVVAPHQDASATEVADAVHQVKKHVQHAVMLYPGTVTSPTAARVGVVSWQSWFPASGQADERFPYMPVERPTGLISKADQVWETAEMLDTAAVEYTPVDQAAARAVLRHARVLAGTPRVLAGQDSKLEIWRHAVDNVGLGSVLEDLEATSAAAPKRGAGIAGRPHPRLSF